MARFELPKLPYSYDALEPHIDARTMEIHHTKHHQAYIDNLNKALDSPDGNSVSGNIEEILANITKVPESIRGAVNFHGGGFDNHSIFWNNMSPSGGGEPTGEARGAIDFVFGDFAKFKDLFSKSALGIQGSGWCWLAYNPKIQKVEMIAMPNQTSPRTVGLTPILGIDVWEHAYYLKYQNRRADYIASWWNVVNWDDVSARLERV